MTKSCLACLVLLAVTGCGDSSGTGAAGGTEASGGAGGALEGGNATGAGHEGGAGGDETGGAAPLACDEGYADCDGDPGNGCETITANNRDACGECNVTCTGFCAVDTCHDVEALSTGDYWGTRIRVTDTDVLWASSASENQSDDAYGIHAMPKAGGAVTALVADSPEITNFIVGDGYLFFSEYDQVHRAALDGSNVETFGGSYYPDLAICNSTLYWTMSYSTLGQILSKGESASAASAATVFRSFPHDYGVFGGADALDCSGTTIAYAGVDVTKPFIRVVQSDGSQEHSATGPYQVSGRVGDVLVHGDQVYYIEFDGSTSTSSLRSTPIAGTGQPQYLFGGSQRVAGLSLDDQYAYVIASETGLVRVRLDGSAPPEVMAPGVYGNATANDGTHVYFLETDGVSRIAK